MTCYVHDHVQQVRALHRDTLDRYGSFATVRELLEPFAKTLYDAYLAGDPRTAVEISNHHPLFIGQPAEDILHHTFTKTDANLTSARAYGFDTWEAVPDRALDPVFEQAVDWLVAGEKDALTAALNAHPDLVTRRSAFGHEATLLHYAGSNGVEMWRQAVPSNLPELVELLLERDADKHATAHFYGALYDTRALAATSAHPADAGLMDALLQVLG